MTRTDSVIRYLSADRSKLYAYGRPPILTAPAVARARGRLSGLGSSSVQTVTPPKTYPYPTYTDRAVYSYTSLYQTGDSLATVFTTRLNAASGGAGGYVSLPNGFDGEFVDFLMATNQYSLYAPLCYGIWGPGSGQARIKLRNGSSTQGSRVPPQTLPDGKNGGTNPLSVIRIGPNNTSTQPAIHMYGLTLEGGDVGHTYNGFSAYWWGPGSTATDIKLKGFGLGDWNSPPGETNMWNNLGGGGALLEGIEADGFLSNGVRAGCAFASNGPSSITYRDVFVHDTLVSGTTFGTLGSVSTGTLTRTIRTYDLKSWNNANHTTASGKTFGAMNHEGVDDVIHVRPNVFVENQPLVQKEHLAINNVQKSSKVTVIDPQYNADRGGCPPWSRGCYAVQIIMPNYAGVAQAQLLSDLTVIQDGVTLQPVHRNDAAAVGVDPSRHFVYQT